jgi:hypothetical protein
MTLADRIAAIEARADAATKGPWDTRDHGVPNLSDVDMSDGTLASVATWRSGDPGTAEETLANAAFIAAARTDVPAICAALKVACEAIRDNDTFVDNDGDERNAKWAASALASIERILGGGK